MNTTTKPASNVLAELAPTGSLRAGMNLGNALFTHRDASGALSGVSVDILQELALRLDVPLEFVVFDEPGQVAGAVDKNEWDVAILAIEKTRAQTIDFSPGLTQLEASYVVRKGAHFESSEQVDAPGVRIAAKDKAGFERYLTRTLQHAQLVREPGFPACIQRFNEGAADALAGLRTTLHQSLDEVPQGRLLADSFMTIQHGLSMAKGRGAALAYLTAFVADLRASGFVARAISKHGVAGLTALS